MTIKKFMQEVKKIMDISNNAKVVYSVGNLFPHKDHKIVNFKHKKALSMYVHTVYDFGLDEPINISEFYGYFKEFYENCTVDGQLKIKLLYDRFEIEEDNRIKEIIDSTPSIELERNPELTMRRQNPYAKLLMLKEDDRLDENSEVVVCILTPYLTKCNYFNVVTGIKYDQDLNMAIIETKYML